ncbi:uncharacterized protein LOC123403037 isoform X2 [Hordeum vulgare subsp. vulgare]|nr:uncharacterized protein LOC123403037 isoform X2 [Hordeum vulgare subsp. vulgare]
MPQLAVSFPVRNCSLVGKLHSSKAANNKVCTQVKASLWKTCAPGAGRTNKQITHGSANKTSFPRAFMPTSTSSLAGNDLPINTAAQTFSYVDQHLASVSASAMAVVSMDPGAGGSSEEERRYGAKITAVVVLSCATAAMAGAIFGYDLGASGRVSSMMPFLREFFPDVYRRMNSGAVSNYCKFDSQLLTLFTSSLYISGLLTAMLLASWPSAVHDHRSSCMPGRRRRQQRGRQRVRDHPRKGAARRRARICQPGSPTVPV